MSKRIKSLAGQVISFALAGVLLYFALKGVDFDEVIHALRTANYLWLIPLAVITVLSHLLRSWRWQILLQALPEAKPERAVGLYSAFTALVIGYFANYAAPRVGELVRSGLLARKEKLNLSGVIGTVVLERVLDMLVLLVLLAFLVFMMLDRADTLRSLFLEPLTREWSAVPGYAMVISGVVVLVLATAVYWWWKKSSNGRDRARGASRLLGSFIQGLSTLFRTRRKSAIIVSTVLMWSCYVVMTYLPFLVLGMTGTYNITLMDSFYLMTLGAIGVAIPAPGGTGSYHYIAIQSLVHLFGVDQSPAATYAVLTHAAQLILYASMGSFFLASQKSSIGDLMRIKDEAASAPQST